MNLDDVAPDRDRGMAWVRNYIRGFCHPFESDVLSKITPNAHGRNQRVAYVPFTTTASMSTTVTNGSSLVLMAHGQLCDGSKPVALLYRNLASGNQLWNITDVNTSDNFLGWDRNPVNVVGGDLDTPLCHLLTAIRVKVSCPYTGYSSIRTITPALRLGGLTDQVFGVSGIDGDLDTAKDTSINMSTYDSYPTTTSASTNTPEYQFRVGAKHAQMVIGPASSAGSVTNPFAWEAPSNSQFTNSYRLHPTYTYGFGNTMEIQANGADLTVEVQVVGRFAIMCRNREQLSAYGVIEPSYPVEWSTLLPPIVGLGAAGAGDTEAEAHVRRVGAIRQQIPGASGVQRITASAAVRPQNFVLPSTMSGPSQRAQAQDAEHDWVAKAERAVETGKDIYQLGTAAFNFAKDAYGLWKSSGAKPDEEERYMGRAYEHTYEQAPSRSVASSSTNRIMSTGHASSGFAA